MLNDITLGQYFPGNSLLHKADPRSKIIATIVYIVTLFVSNNIISFAACALTGIFFITISSIPIKIIIKGLKPVIFILFFTFLINVFFTGGENLAFEIGIISVYYEGIYKAFIMSVRIIFLIAVTSLFLSYTTSPIMLTDAIEELLRPLNKIKIPFHEFAMMMTIALRFIPTLVEETDKIIKAQKSRGADFTEGGLVSKAKALVPILIPLFVSSFRRADELAVAMECRCYRGGDGRTKLKCLAYTKTDALFLFIFIVFLTSVILLNIYFATLNF